MSRILIVDDEPTLLNLQRRYLERQGYEVETSESAEEALTLFDTDPRRFDIVITDLTLPGANGAELLERMRAKNPTLPGLIASGYPYEPQLKDVGFLQKPYMPKELVEQITSLLKR
jgi:DNA-binding response OmpR family regulator